MLQSIRDKTHGWIAGIIVSLLIFSFAMWGIHSYFQGSGDNNVVAKVNGVEITKYQLGAAYERLRRQVQMQSGTAQLPAGADIDLKKRALQALIHVQVLEQASFADQYRITPDQIDGFLQGMPDFQVNGVFSPVRFQQTLNAMSFTVPDFVNLVRASLLADQPRLGIIFTSFALPDEVTDTMALIGQERNIRYLIVPESYFNQQTVQVSPAAIQAWYAGHQDAFKTPEQVSIEYILLSVPDLASKIHPTEAELKKFYVENAGSATQPTKVMQDKLKETFIRQKAEEAFANLGEKAANVAYEHPDSLQAVAKESGVSIQTTGLFTKDQALKKGMEKDITANVKIREAAFGNDVLTLQNNSDLIRLDPETAVILRVKSHVPAAVLPLNTVRNQIAEKLKTIQIEEKLSGFAKDIATKLKTGQVTPEQIASESHLQWTEARYVGRHASQMDQAILDAAFQMPQPSDNTKTVYAATKIAKGFAVIALMGVRPGNTQGSAEHYQAFSDQIQSSFGALEYELYKDSLVHQAKIVLES
ncbi:MAG TPA: SurA N-terminal domain-containing protein [Gammaproteobacteria bacterium]|nr:SurA N-terminal domain-containing protein [Gammaproteobacteria bacterium]